VSEVSGFR